MNKKTLFLTMTHGDEPMGKRVMEKIDKEYREKKNNYHWIVVNKKAAQKKKRFLKNNMNRIAPGDINAKDYEKKRVAEVINLAKNFSTTIDIHTTKSDVGIFTIVGKPTPENLFLAASLQPKNIVIWNPEENENGPIINYVPTGVGIEAGPRTSKKIEEDLYRVCEDFIQQDQKEIIKKIKTKKWFYVVGKLEKKCSQEKKIKNFKALKIKGKTYYPIMVGSYGKAAHLAKKINWSELFSYKGKLLESK